MYSFFRHRCCQRPGPRSPGAWARDPRRARPPAHRASAAAQAPGRGAHRPVIPAAAGSPRARSRRPAGLVAFAWPATTSAAPAMSRGCGMRRASWIRTAPSCACTTPARTASTRRGASPAAATARPPAEPGGPWRPALSQLGSAAPGDVAGVAAVAPGARVGLGHGDLAAGKADLAGVAQEEGPARGVVAGVLVAVDAGDELGVGVLVVQLAGLAEDRSLVLGEVGGREGGRARRRARALEGDVDVFV